MRKTLAHLARSFLTIFAVFVVVASFIDVGARLWSSRAAKVERPITLTILHWGDNAENQIVQTLVDQYMTDNPRVRVVRIHAGDFSGKLKTMMAAGTPPDLFYLPPDLLPQLAQLDLIEPIDAYIGAVTATEQGKAWFADFFPILIDAFRYDAATGRTGAGPLFGLPKDFTTPVMYVNVDLFNAAGVPVPYDGWTWAEFESAVRKITDLRKTPEFAGRTIYGGFLGLWPDTLRQVIWSHGGEFFATAQDGTPDFRTVALDQPAAQEALSMIARLRLSEGTVYNPTGVAKEGGQEFFTGNIGVIGPLGRWQTPRFAGITGFKWDVVPVPVKAHERKYQDNQMFLTAWTMSSKSEHKDEAFKLMKFLTGPEGAAMQSRLGLAIPPLQSVAASDDFLAPPGLPPHRADIFIRAIETARIQQNPRESEWGRIVGDRINESIQNGEETTLKSANTIQSVWLTELDSPLRRKEWGGMPWGFILATAGSALAGLVAFLWWRSRREKIGPLDRAQARSGWAFIAPWLIGFALLTAGPMLMSMLLSFGKWQAMTPVADADYVGLANYHQLVAYDPTFYQSLWVTGYFVLLAVPITQVAALAVALLMNSNVRGIALFRTVYFVPSVVSGVALAVLWLQIFNNDYGLLNRALAPIAGLFGATPPDWFGRDAAAWAIPAFVIMGLWGVGGGMIIYLAGLKGIPTSLYEAATIDGAGPIRKLFVITIPMLSPLIFYNLVMGIIGSFQVFTQAYVMTGAGPGNSTLFYVLNLYRQAFEFHNMGYASAMAWILFVICLLLTIFVFAGSRRLVYYEGLKA